MSARMGERQSRGSPVNMEATSCPSGQSGSWGAGSPAPLPHHSGGPHVASPTTGGGRRQQRQTRTQVEAAAWCAQGVPTSGTGQVAFSPLHAASSWQPAGVPELEDRPRPLLVWGSSILV